MKIRNRQEGIYQATAPPGFYCMVRLAVLVTPAEATEMVAVLPDAFWLVCTVNVAVTVPLRLLGRAGLYVVRDFPDGLGGVFVAYQDAVWGGDDDEVLDADNSERNRQLVDDDTVATFD